MLLFSALFISWTSVQANTDDNWILKTNDYNAASYAGAPLANGTIGILPWKEPFSIRHIILNHIFEINGSSNVNQMLSGINPYKLTMIIDGHSVDGKSINNWEQYVNMREATHNTSFDALDKVHVDYTVLAPRCLPYCTVLSVHLKALKDVDISFDDHPDTPSGEYQAPNMSYNKDQNIILTTALTSHGRYNVCNGLMFITDNKGMEYAFDYDRIFHARFHMNAGEERTIHMTSSTCTSHDFSDPASECQRQLIYVQIQGMEKIMAQHKKLWSDLWKSDIQIEGDDEAQKVVRFALYNLYSYCRKGTDLSISPMGLSSQGYNGHIFWDSELWMYPPMLYMNQDIATCMINYRANRLKAAQRRASSNGYEGAMFPWESDDFGEESTPIWATTGQFEHHITGDIAFGAWNYYCVTHNKQWLKEKGWPLIKNAAEFWASRVELNSDGTYSINRVIGADEDAGVVDDNAFTNGSAVMTFRCAAKAAKVMGESIPAEWNAIANKIVFKKTSEGVTTEYRDYDGRHVKQGDVNLLAYPFNVITDKAQIKKDMDYYAAKMSDGGPAMGFGVFTVIYERLGDVKSAEECFRKSYRRNVRPPFSVFAESAYSDNPYFCTGAGSMLQGIICGFGGLSITEQGIVQVKSTLPSSWKKLTITGVGPQHKTYTVTH